MVWIVKWTTEMDDYLRYADPKISYTQIAADMSNIFEIAITRNSVIGRAHRLNLSKPLRRAKPKILKIAKPKVEKPIKEKKATAAKKPPHEENEIEHKDRIIQQMLDYHRVQGRTEFVNPEAKSLTFDGLKSDNCRFPLGDKKTNNLRFCGAPVDKTKSYPYCEYCYRIVYIPISDHKWRKKYANIG